ncbi:hypothetical protein BCY84_13935 [Trypanosoma cruzi cruzi]|nr:hypothetical protein BCY84_13935 [Trypanosoma cruzi cruzi]
MDARGVTIPPARVGNMARNSLAVKIPAGRMLLQDGIVKPLLGRGLLCLMRDSLMDELVLTWVPVDGGEEHRFTLPQGKVQVSWVEKCKSGRVLLFDVDKGKQFLFFWMQSRSTDLAEKMMRRLQYILERHRHYPVNAPSSQAIQMSTFRRILEEVREGAVALDVDLEALLASSKLIEALQEDPEFYRSRVVDYLPSSSATVTDTPVDLVSLVQDSQVQWAAVILSTMLRHQATSTYLSSLFLDAAAPWGLGVVSFIMQIIQAFLE